MIATWARKQLVHHDSLREEQWEDHRGHEENADQGDSSG